MCSVVRVARQGHTGACLAMGLDCCLFICVSERRTQEGWPWCVACQGAARVFESEKHSPRDSWYQSKGLPSRRSTWCLLLASGTCGIRLHAFGCRYGGIQSSEMI